MYESRTICSEGGFHMNSIAAAEGYRQLSTKVLKHIPALDSSQSLFGKSCRGPDSN